MKKEVTRILLAAVIFTAVSCKSSKEAGGKGSQGGQPTVAEIFQQMDANKDSKLSKDEVKGPLLNDFAKIDTNSDGFISVQELEKAPKPSGQRPQQRQGGQQGPPPGRN